MRRLLSDALHVCFAVCSVIELLDKWLPGETQERCSSNQDVTGDHLCNRRPLSTTGLKAKDNGMKAGKKKVNLGGCLSANQPQYGLNGVRVFFFFFIQWFQGTEKIRICMGWKVLIIARDAVMEDSSVIDRIQERRWERTCEVPHLLGASGRGGHLSGTRRSSTVLINAKLPDVLMRRNLFRYCCYCCCCHYC